MVRLRELAGARSQRMLVALAIVAATCGALVACERQVSPGPAETATRNGLVSAAARLTAARASLAGLRSRAAGIPETVGHLPEASFRLQEQRLSRLGENFDELAAQSGVATHWQRTDAFANISQQLESRLARLAEVETELLTLDERATQLEERARQANKFARTLKTGVRVEGAADGLERSLLDFLEGDSSLAKAADELRFDQLRFERGGVEPDPELSCVSRGDDCLGAGQAQLLNLAFILATYPELTLTLDGHTDTLGTERTSSVGTRAAEKQLSLARANAVKKMLLAVDVSGARLQAVGHGAEVPLCRSSDSLQCRLANRRVTVTPHRAAPTAEPMR